MRRPFSTQRWPLVVAVRAGEARARARIAFAASGLCFLTASGIGVGLAGAAGVTVRVLLGLVAAACFAAALRAKRPTVRPSGAYLEADDAGVFRVTADGKKSLVEYDAPYGVSLLASYGRPYALLAFTTPTQTRYVPVRIDDRSEQEDELFARIAVLADLDLVDGITHDPALPADQAALLVRFLERRDKDALGRVYLSDGRGAPISLDRATLAVGAKTFDLSSGLEWRALMFHESTGQAAPLYQATWIRQGMSEVVLVAPMPASIVPREQGGHKELTGRLGRALTRGIKLLQAPAEAPPARDLRVAIDRPFMMAVRRALAEAPLATRVVAEPPARASRPERRA